MAWPTQWTITLALSPSNNWIMSHSLINMKAKDWGNTREAATFEHNLYKSTGPDKLHPRILRALEDKLARPLTHIFNNWVETVIIPEDLKSANVIAIIIHRKGSRQEPRNYRPTNLTSVVCKTMERLVKGRLITHLEMNNLIGDSQHCFRNKRNCLTCLLDFFSQVIDAYCTDNKKVVNLVYLDFQKAVEKVPHERLMVKVNTHGIQGDAARCNSAVRVTCSGVRDPRPWQG